jgi:hypothetical protein
VAVAIVIGCTLALVSRTHAAPIDSLVDVVVVSPNAKRVRTLSASDFVVRVDGREYRPDQALALDRPLSVALVVDVSASATERLFASAGGRFDPRLGTPPLVRLRDVLDASFVQRLRAGDKAVIAMFARRVLSMRAYSSDRMALAQALEGLLTAVPPDDRLGPTPTWDALGSLLSALPPSDGGQNPALLVVTDGEVSESRSTVADVIAQAVARHVAVNVISLAFDLDIPQSDGSVMPFRPNRDLSELARATHGVFLFQGERRPYRTGNGIPGDAESARLTAARWHDISQPLVAAVVALQHPYRLHVSGVAPATADHSTISVAVKDLEAAVVHTELARQ